MRRGFLLSVLAVLAVTIGAGLAAFGDHAGPRTLPSPEPTEHDSELIEVHVAGWVESPGVVRLPEGSIVADAVAAAGGFRPGASADAVNLAARLSDGEQVMVGGPGETAPEASSDGRVDINRASASELESLPGVGPVLAERIVAYREANGPFHEVEDLLDVPGIGESKLASMRDRILAP